MSFFGSSGVPASDLRPLSVAPERTAQSAHGRPVPYVFGKVRVGVTFISEPWAIRSTEVKTDMGKKDEVTGYNYWCSFAAAICVGPIDAVHEIRMDDTVVWTTPE